MEEAGQLLNPNRQIDLHRLLSPFVLRLVLLKKRLGWKRIRLQMLYLGETGGDGAKAEMITSPLKDENL